MCLFFIQKFLARLHLMNLSVIFIPLLLSNAIMNCTAGQAFFKGPCGICLR